MSGAVTNCGELRGLSAPALESAASCDSLAARLPLTDPGGENGGEAGWSLIGLELLTSGTMYLSLSYSPVIVGCADLTVWMPFTGRG